MTYLWDTCVLSGLGKTHRDPFVVEYLASIPTHQTYISAITLGEIKYGLGLLPLGTRRQELEEVMNDVVLELTARILPVTADIARIWGQLSANTRKRGLAIEVGDGLIAATALHHGMHVVTRNVKDFEPTGALLINPWDHAD